MDQQKKCEVAEEGCIVEFYFACGLCGGSPGDGRCVSCIRGYIPVVAFAE